MNIPDNNILVYESLTDLYYADPYALLDIEEANRIIFRFEIWRRMIETHPHLGDAFADQKTAFLSTLPALAEAIQGAKQARLFPKIILPESQYKCTMTLWKQAEDAMPEVKKLLEEAGLLAGW